MIGRALAEFRTNSVSLRFNCCLTEDRRNEGEGRSKRPNIGTYVAPVLGARANCNAKLHGGNGTHSGSNCQTPEQMGFGVTLNSKGRDACHDRRVT